MSYRRKLLLLFLFVGLLPLGVALAIHSVSFYHSAQEAAQRHLAETARHAAMRLDDLMLGVSRDFGAIAAEHHLVEDPADEISGHLARFTYLFPYFTDLIWADGGGVVRAASNRRLVGERLAGRYPQLEDELAEIRRGPGGRLRISDLDDVAPSLRARAGEGRIGQHDLQIQFLVRVDDRRGEFKGVLVAVMGAEAIADVLDTAARDLPGARPALLLGRDGVVLASSAPGERVLVPHALAPALADDGADVHVLRDGGERLLAAHARTSGFGTPRAAEWQVLIQVPESAITGVVWHTLGWSALAMLLLLAVAVALGGTLSHTIGSRIESLAAAARKLAGGDLGTRLPVKGRDELARLTQDFNAMAAELDALVEHKAEDAARLTALAGELEARNGELAQALAHSERQNRQVMLRNEMGDLLHSCMGMGEAGAVIARYMPRLFPGASGAVYLHNAGATLVATARWGEAAVAESLGLADCWALRRGKTHRVGCEDESLACVHISRPFVGNAVCVPLAAHGETFGLLHLVCPCACVTGGAVTQTEQLLAEALAAQIGMALANLRLRETLREQTIHDVLTSLYNRRFIEEALPRELARARRGGSPLAVFMLDVDHFKRFNDEHGHEAGDAVLRALGQAMRDNCRKGDLACRFGGEEFTVILAGTGLADAREWGERLMRRVRRMEVKASGTTLPPITVSLGLALHPEHGEDMETLLQAADLALYDAKHAGRDRLAVCGDSAPAGAAERT